ncbi:MAG: D-TA family PLP-dependent enzyme [Verrucomicrobia bacterium]|nr:D-TA family PLP-dependent enzyme [Verrucomicrobiota bacterium]
MAWYSIRNADQIPSPALLVYPERVSANLARMLTIAGDPTRLRPHLKTHKLAEVLRLQTARGISRFKCATIAEAELAAGCGVPDLLLAYPPVGPNVARLLRLIQAFPQTNFLTIADDPDAIRALAAASVQANVRLELLLDIDCGQHRSGVAPGPRAHEIYHLIAHLPGLRPGGLHAYDGHIHDASLAARAAHCETAWAPVSRLRDELRQAGLPVPRVVAGGTPTFPFHARRGDVECSPGTCVFWDAGYEAKFPDLGFAPAALVLTRVVSKPGANRLCLDLGHKAVASENPPPRVRFLNLPEATAVAHSEEHLVVETPAPTRLGIGDCLFGVPWHICPTVALHAEAVVIENGEATQRWQVAARDRRLTI